MLRKVGMTGRLREDEVESACNPVINFQLPKSFIGQFHGLAVLGQIIIAYYLRNHHTDYLLGIIED